MMRRTFICAVLVLALLPAGAGAYTYAEILYGDVMPPYDARSLALGGAGVASADGARGLAMNPALLGKCARFDVAVTGFVIAAEEARDIPLHDSFDGIIADNTYALNTNLYDRYIASVAVNPADVLEADVWMPVIGVGYRPVLDMDYHYHVQYRDPDSQTEPNDKILYDYYLDQDGGVNALSVALGGEVVPSVFAGVGVDFLRGDFDGRARWVFPPDSEETDAEERLSYDDLSGQRFTFGLLSEQLHRFDLAVVYRTGFTLEGDFEYSWAWEDSLDDSGSLELEYPDVWTFGVQYHPRNGVLTTVSFDLEYARWSGFEDSTRDTDFDDTITYRVGVEHAFYDDTQARFGFSYQPSYIDESTTRAAFSAGLGLKVLGVPVDIGGQVGLREYDHGEGRVRETTTMVMATVVHSF